MRKSYLWDISEEQMPKVLYPAEDMYIGRNRSQNLKVCSILF